MAEITSQQKLTPWSGMPVFLKPLIDLEPYARNAKLHPEEQIVKLVGSLLHFGWTNPVLIDSNEGITAGHGRVLAAARIWDNGGAIHSAFDATLVPRGMIPCIELKNLSKDQVRQYILADNVLSESGWDLELLPLELAEMRLENIDLTPIGFDAERLETLLPSVEPHKDPDEVPKPPAAVDVFIYPGDLWLLGKHRLICGDSTDMSVVRKVLNEELADIVWTDPPWNVAHNIREHQADKAEGRQHHKHMLIANDNLGAAFPGFCATVAANLKSATKPGAPLYLVMGSKEWPNVDAALRNAGFHWSSTIIWRKHSFAFGRGDYHSQYEPMWYGWNAGVPCIFHLKERNQSDVWDIDRPMKSADHPTTKPVALVAKCLENSSEIGAKVIDFFAGSGTSIIASEQTGRVCYAIELEPIYNQIIISRWMGTVHGQAILEETGETFDAVCKRRRLERAGSVHAPAKPEKSPGQMPLIAGP